LASEYELIISENAKAREYFWEGARFKEKGALADANTLFKRALEKSDDCFIGTYLLWDICDIRGDSEAADYYSAKLNDYPDYDDEYREVVDMYYNGAYSKAIEQGEGYIEQHHDTVDAIAVCHFIGRALYFQGKDMGRAWDVLNEAFTYSSLMPGTVPAYDVGEEVVITFVKGPRP
jgi:tetratricopeptide (TPR) repeat protein